MKKNRIISLLLIIMLTLLIINPSVFAESNVKIYINEICSGNNGENGNLTDLKDLSGSYCDWIELYNPNAFDVDLRNWWISDKEDNPYMTRLKNSTIIKSKGFVVIYCSKDFSGDETKPTAALGLSGDGETLILTDPQSRLIDKVAFPELDKDATYGRISDGSDNFYIMNPSPLTLNNKSTAILLEAPDFSATSGFFDSEFDLNITTNYKDSTIYYTTDSSNPATSSTRIKYDGSIRIKNRAGEPNFVSAVSPSLLSPYSTKSPPNKYNVDKATVIRACVVDSNSIASKTITNTYFLGKEFADYGNVSILSVVTEYNNLFDYDTGIYANGKYFDEFVKKYPNETRSWAAKGNFSQKGREWERDCYIDFFDSNNQLQISQDCGIRIHGGVSRTNLQKSLRFYSRKEYGEKYFNHSFFQDALDVNGEVISKYKTFIVRNGGNDADYLKFTDNFNQKLAGDKNMETQAGIPCAVFLDGEFWGAYVLQEDYDNDYFEQTHKVDKDEVIVYKAYKVDEGIESDSDYFFEMFDFIRYNSMANEANYKKACELLDMQSFIDYMSAEMYINNEDWPSGNWAFWRTRGVDESNPYADGRWRMLLYDTEFGMKLFGNVQSAYDYDRISGIVNLNPSSWLGLMINSLLKNNTFKEQFVTSFMDFVNINFNPSVALPLLDEMFAQYTPLFQKNYIRNGTTSLNSRTQRYNQIKEFISKRPAVVGNILKNALQLDSNIVRVKVDVNDLNTGEVKINDRFINLKSYSNNQFDGRYFTDHSITLTAVPKAGYEFVGWEGVENGSNPEIKLMVSQAVNVKAVFKEMFLYGDANNDNAVNAKDSLLLRKYISNYLVEINLAKADVNVDGIANSKDSLLLKKHLANWDVKLGEKD